MPRIRFRASTAAFHCLLFALLAVSLSPLSPRAAIPDNVTTRNFFGEGFTFNRPVLLKQFPDMDSVYLVLEQTGGMYRVEHDGEEWVRHRFDSAYVTGINGIVNEGSPGGLTDDGGLLGFAFHPDYANNRRYFIYYVDPAYPGGTVYPGTIVMAERTADSTLLSGSGQPQKVLLALPKPYMWHNGGTLRFGKEGYLYTAIGDGGSGGDPENRAQNPDTLHGKFLRIDVDGSDDFADDTTRNYAIPPGNPFADSAGYLPETWALGLRSPWKWDFHPLTGEIWLGDVGQGTREKVTRVLPGSNLGWDVWEGFDCHSGPCSWDGFTEPVLDLERSEALSVTGGVFFTGDPEGEFHGLYIFGDYGRSTVWALREYAGEAIERAEIGTVSAVVSFDKDSRGRVFAVSIRSSDWDHTGTVQILESPDMIPAPPVNVNADRARPGPATRISVMDVLRNPAAYEVRTLDGRLLRGKPSGTVWVRKRGESSPPQLLTMVP